MGFGKGRGFSETVVPQSRMVSAVVKATSTGTSKTAVQDSPAAPVVGGSSSSVVLHEANPTFTTVVV